MAFVKAINSRVSTFLGTETSHIQLNSNASLPLNQRPRDKGLLSYEVFLRTLGGTIETTTTTPKQNEVSEHDGQTPATKNMCILRSGNNAPEEATAAEAKRQVTQIQDSTPEEDTVAEMEGQ